MLRLFGLQRKEEKINIFVVNKDPALAAKDLCDQHVVKMTLETAQMLCSAYEPGVAPYKRTHYNHPCTVWTRTTKENYLWLAEHGLELSNEFKYRNLKTHKCESIIKWCIKHMDQINFIEKTKGLTEFAQCMPEQYKISGDVVQSYKIFYIKEKSIFAKWQKGREAPDWYKNSELLINKS